MYSLLCINKNSKTIACRCRAWFINPTCPPPPHHQKKGNAWNMEDLKRGKTNYEPDLPPPPRLESSGFQFLARGRVLHGKLKCLNGHVLATFHEAVVPNDRLWHRGRLLGIPGTPKADCSRD